MRSPRECLTDNRIEQIIAILLRAGVLAAVTVVLAGGLLYLSRHGAEQPHYSTFSGEPSRFRTLEGVWDGVKAGNARSLIQLGLLLLLITPVLRVLFSVFAFALRRDLLYTLITLFVLAVLFYSLGGR